MIFWVFSWVELYPIYPSLPSDLRVMRDLSLQPVGMGAKGGGTAAGGKLDSG